MRRGAAMTRCLGAAVLTLAAAGASAEGAPGGGRRTAEPSTATAPGTSGTASRLPGGGTTRTLTMPGNGGVAGTGLGGSTGGPAGRPGTGSSVKGPPGQGIDGQAVEGRGLGAGTDGARP